VKALALKAIAAGRTFGPYLAIELLLPGGSLVALLLWLYRTYARPADYGSDTGPMRFDLAPVLRRSPQIGRDKSTHRRLT